MTTKLLLALALVGAVCAGEPAAPDKAYLVPTGLTSPIATLAFSRDVIFHGPKPDESRWLVVHADPDCRGHEDAYSPAKVKLTVHREPTVTRKADGSWEIAFAGKAAESAAINASPQSRAYTVEEIDRLRSAVSTLVSFGTLRPENGQWGRSFSSGECDKVTEERMQTYMKAGITAADLWAEADKKEKPAVRPATALEAARKSLPPAPPAVLWPNEVWQAESDKRTLDHPDFLNWVQKFTVEVSGKRYEFGLRSDGCVVWRERQDHDDKLSVDAGVNPVNPPTKAAKDNAELKQK